VAGAITGFGQMLLKWVKSIVDEVDGLTVLYGDTDSIFVKCDQLFDPWKKGRQICEWINEQLQIHVQDGYGLSSQMELEFEKYFAKFFLPIRRGNPNVGRAKGYAGLCIGVNGEETIEITGMEAVRSDWTDIAHHLQEGMLELLFHDAPAKDLESYVWNTVARLRKGESDENLIYKKRLRKPLESYRKTLPPHVKAAKKRLAQEPRGTVAYVITVDGPQPIENITSRIDYRHYVEKQIKPIVETISSVISINMSSAIYGQETLFPH
jgi:DNA polymerase-2